MAPSDNLSTLIQEVLSRFNNHIPGPEKGKTNGGKDGGKGISISPEQALVIAGIIANALNVESVLVDRDQRVEIVLTGSLRRKTPLDKMLDQIGSMPFDDVLRAYMERLT